jgi:hypothetical protein
MQNTASFRYGNPYERTRFAKQAGSKLRPCLSSPQPSGVHGQPAETPPMSGFPAAAIPCIDIPRHFEGTLEVCAKFADAVVAACPDGWPPELILDFDRLNFIQPAGVIFLSNLICWLNGTAPPCSSSTQTETT